MAPPMCIREKNTKKYKKIPLSGNHYLTVVEGFVCPYDPESYVVWSRVLLVGSPMTNWSLARGLTKNSGQAGRT